MLKKTITYTNLFTEQQVTEDFYFHLSKADLVEMQVENHAAEYTAKTGEFAGQKLTGMQAHLQKIAESNDGPTVMGEFKALLRRAYLKRVGDKPIKSPEIWEEFASSEAYSELIYELLTDATAAAQFFAAMVPGNFKEQMAAVAAEVEARKAADPAQGDNAVETPALEKAATALEEDDPTGLTTPEPTLAQRLEAATPENPVTLTRHEAVIIDGDELQSGLATGRIKLS